MLSLLCPGSRWHCRQSLGATQISKNSHLHQVGFAVKMLQVESYNRRTSKFQGSRLRIPNIACLTWNNTTRCAVSIYVHYETQCNATDALADSRTQWAKTLITHRSAMIACAS